MTSCSIIVTSLSFFRFLTNLELFGSRIPDAQSIKLTFLLIVTFYLTKTERKIKKSLTQLSHRYFEQRYYFCQKMLIFCKKMLTSAKLSGPWYQKVYFLKLHMCVYLRTKFEVSSIILTSFKQRGYFTPPFLPSPPTQNLPLKSPL